MNRISTHKGRARYLYLTLIILFTSPTLTKPAAATTKDVFLADKTMHLPIPVGYCPLDDRFQSDRTAIEGLAQFVTGSLNLLVLFVRCDQLEIFRDGQTPYTIDFGMYATTQPPRHFQGVSRQAYVAAVEEKLNQTLPTDATNQFFDMARRQGVDISPSNFKVGLLPKDENAAYVSYAIDQGKTVLACIAGFTLVADIEIGTYAYTQISTLHQFDELKSKSRVLVRNLLNAN